MFLFHPLKKLSHFCMYAVAINLPRLLAMPTNLMELSNCCISLENI
jgi:hypothetical protein